jgi:hypothetical protein
MALLVVAAARDDIDMIGSGVTADSIGIITSGEQKPLSFWSAAGLAAGGVR